MFLTIILLLITLIILAGLIWLEVESLREQEPRTPKVAFGGAVLFAVLGLVVMLLPESRLWVGLFYLLIIALGVYIAWPGESDPAALAGCEGMIKGVVTRFDERDQVFARNRALRPGSEEYRRYYEAHPELQEVDDQRRARGGNVGKQGGSIDGGYAPNVEMMNAAFSMPPIYGPHAQVQPREGVQPQPLDPALASQIVKGFARDLGADLVGVCKTDKRWQYSHRGEIFYDNWEDWGAELDEPLPYSLVFAVEMAQPNVAAAPHTPSVVESAVSYAKGAAIGTALARWFGGMGYRAIANHSRNYDLLMVPMAVEAGLGELSRQGYLIAPDFGPRVRIFVVTTDMELASDTPIDLGVQAFCTYCKKCAESCPSNSLPTGGKVVVRGVEKWQLDADSCYEYWAKVGTDCSVCMAVCPYSRPNTALHRLVRYLIRRSKRARRILPHFDNFIYGRRWKPRRPPSWIEYRREKQAQTPAAH